MKTLELTGTGLDSLVHRERPTPAFGPRDLLVRTLAVGLNYRDLAIARGEYGHYRRPLILGADAVGQVISVGAEVTRFAVGQRIAPNDTPDWLSGPPDERTLARRLGGPDDGVLAERIVVGEDAAVAVPAYLSDEEAATLCGAGVTAWQALFPLGRLRPGETVVVQGTGGVSIYALQLARAAGARVIVLSRSAAKLERALALGAQAGIDTGATPEWEREVLRLTEGRGANLVVDVVGGAFLARSVAAARVGGQVVALGFLGGLASSLDLGVAIRRSVTIKTSTGRSRESFEALVRALAAARIRPVVDRVFDFAAAKEAFIALAAGEQLGKLVVRIGAREVV